jgi:hypothetical protein
MLRVVLAVAIAAALLGTAMPVVDDARVTKAQIGVETELDRLERAAKRLVARNDIPPGDAPGARRAIVLRLPERTWGSRGLAVVRFPPLGNQKDPSWRIGEGPLKIWRPDVTVGGATGGVALQEGGRTKLVLTLQRIDGEPVVIVSRHDFISDGAATATHARTQDSASGTVLQ